MRTDHTTYQLATRVSVAGFVIQVIVSLVVLIFGLAAQDHVTQAAGWYMLLGLPVWFTLILLYHQHRLERIEAIEAEQIAQQTGRSTSIFDSPDSDLNVAARRLRWMHQVLVPTMSLLTAIGLLAVGFWQLRELNARISEINAANPLRIVSTTSAPWGLAITAAIAIGCFVFSRYVSGMSKQIAWRNLRAGASVTVGAALASAALAIGFGFVTAGNETAMLVLARVIPIVIMIGGVEITINFVLNLYKPRKAGEFPRPAFDSRILSLVAAPDSIAKSISEAINYQFGFEVTSTWFYRLISRQIWVLVVFCIMVLIALNCASIVRPYEQAIVLSFGQQARDGKVYDSGLIWKWPWESVETYPVYRVQRIRIGKEYKDENAPILWSKQHTTETEDLVIVGPMRETGRQGEMGRDEQNVVARNYSVLNFEVPIQYRIKNGVDQNGEPALWNYVMFTAGSDQQRQDLIREFATRVITRRAAQLRIDDVLGPMRSQLAYELRQLLQQELDNKNAGIEVLFVGISGIHPPVDVAGSFEEVLKAREEREAKIQEAEADAIRELASVAGTEVKAREVARELASLDQMAGSGTPESAPEFRERRAEVERLLLEAGGEAATTLLNAQADRWAKHMNAWAKYIQQESQSLAYQASPRLYTTREYLLRVSNALSDARLFITAPGYENDVTVLLQEDATSLDFQPEQSK